MGPGRAAQPFDLLRGVLDRLRARSSVTGAPTCGAPGDVDDRPGAPELDGHRLGRSAGAARHERDLARERPLLRLLESMPPRLTPTDTARTRAGPPRRIASLGAC